jgi:aryl-alcohol dehydrogenase-like predicted oxidoreductase
LLHNQLLLVKQTMERKLLGRTELKVTPLGLGLAALGRPGYINLKHSQDLGPQKDVSSVEQHAHGVLDAAWEAGIRYFDVARSYGLAEAFLASWLSGRRISPDEVTVGSKWGYVYTADWQVNARVHEVKEHSLDVLHRQRRESDQNLGKYLGLYQIHSATLDSGVLENQEVLEQLSQYQQEGLVIGLTLSGPNQAVVLRRAMEIAINGQLLFGCVEATWNLLEPSAGPTLQEANRRGMGVIVKEALANGRLTENNEDPSFASKLKALKQAADEQETTVDAIALAAVLAQPWADVVLSGATTRQQVISNVAAAQIIWSPTLAERFASMVETPERYWEKRSSLRWT